MMKRRNSAMLTALLVLSMIPLAAPAAAATSSVEWDFSNGKSLTKNAETEIARLSSAEPAGAQCRAVLELENGTSIHRGNNAIVRLNGDRLITIEGFEDVSNVTRSASAGFVATGSDQLVVYIESTGATITSTKGSLTVTCDTPPPPGDEGCTPGYWKQPHHAFAWDDAGVSPDATVGSVFGSTIGFADTTLFEALRLRGNRDGQALVRHAVAGYLNASSPDVAYLWTIDQVLDAAAAGDTHALEGANEAGCPLGNGR